MGGDDFLHLHHLNSLLTRGLTLGGGDGGDVLTKNSRGGKPGRKDELGCLWVISLSLSIFRKKDLHHLHPHSQLVEIKKFSRGVDV
jgi:hypothetical protein